MWTKRVADAKITQRFQQFLSWKVTILGFIGESSIKHVEQTNCI